MKERTILIVDENSINRKLYEYILKPIGVPMIFAESFNSAVCIINEDLENKICLMMTSFYLGGSDGKELCKSIHKNRPEIKKVLYAAMEMSFLIQEMKDVYPHIIEDYFQLPVDNNQVFDNVCKILQDILVD